MTWQSDNRNTVARDIEEGKREGRYKDCAHLDLKSRGDRHFSVACNKQSLERPDVFGKGYGPASDPRCPTDCLFFTARTEEVALEESFQVALPNKVKYCTTYAVWDEVPAPPAMFTLT